METLTAVKRPESLRLPMTFDVEKMQRDLRTAQELSWSVEEPFGFNDFVGSDVTVFHDGQWKGLSLRSQGGDWRRSDPGGPGLEPYVDTEVLAKTPYFKEILERFDCFIRTVRLSSLPAGVAIAQHCDTYHDFKYGQIRLHLPVLTHQDVVFVIDERRCEWQAGELWYGDFSLPHRVENNSPVNRVHMIIDVTLNDFVLGLFPPDFVAGLEEGGIVMHEDPITLPAAELARFQCGFVIPAGLMKGIFEMDDGIPGQFHGSIRSVGDELVLFVDERPLIALYPVAPRRFCFVGWMSERYLEFTTAEGTVSQLDLVMRHGHSSTRVRMALEPTPAV